MYLLFRFIPTIITKFDICGSVHHHLINKTTNVTQLGATVFIIPWKALYMFRVLFTPIIRSVLKLHMQLLVPLRIGTVSDPVCYKTIRSRERTALAMTKLGLIWSWLVLYAPDFRSVLKLYMHLLVQSRIGMVSDPVCYKMIRSTSHDQIRTNLVMASAVRSRLLIIL
jgi:hypothetical protein